MTRCMHVSKGKQCIKAAHGYGLHVYRPIAKVGARKLRELVDVELFRTLVQANADGYCEAAGLTAPGNGFVCRGIRHAGTDPHHLHPEDRDRNVHDPERGIWVCRQAHSWAHDNPDAARLLGLLRPEPERAS